METVIPASIKPIRDRLIDILKTHKGNENISVVIQFEQFNSHQFKAIFHNCLHPVTDRHFWSQVIQGMNNPQNWQCVLAQTDNEQLTLTFCNNVASCILL